MASPLQMISSPYLKNSMSCFICRERHDDVLLLRCGHTFCTGCIGREVEKEGGAELSKCPKCETLNSRPQMHQIRCNIAMSILSSPYEDTTGILFTCNQSPIPTIKFCPQNGVSLCMDHLMALNKSPGHDQPNTKRCPDHTRPQAFYCVDDDANVCAHCISRHHRGHHVESVFEAPMKKKELSSSEAEDKTQDQRQLEARGLGMKVSLLFHDLRKHLEVLEKKVLGKVLRQVEQVSAPCHDEIQEMDSGKDEAKTMASIKELYISSKSSPTVLEGQEPEDVGGAAFQETGETHHLEAALILHSHTDELLSADCNGCFMNREADIVLDEDTAGNNIQILHRMGLSYMRWKEAHKPKTPQRFKDHQVLSSTIFSKGRHFYTLETSKWGNWRFGMAYPSIARKGFRSYIGCSDKSWGLCRWKNQYSAMHACKVTELPDEFTCERFGVYLDYEAGHLSFHELSNPIRHLHTFTTTFTEPLHAVFRLWVDSHADVWMFLNDIKPDGY